MSELLGATMFEKCDLDTKEISFVTESELIDAAKEVYIDDGASFISALKKMHAEGKSVRDCGRPYYGCMEGYGYRVAPNT